MALGAETPFVVLGGGPAGLAAAYKLSQRGWNNNIRRATKGGAYS